MQELKAAVLRKLEKANEGLEEWDEFIRRINPTQEDYIFLFPEGDRECSYYGMLYLDTFLQRQNGKKAYVITDSDYVEENVKKYSTKIEKTVWLENSKIKKLIALYELFLFEPRFIVVSLDEPFCRNTRRIIGVKGTSVEQLVAIGIYHIIPFESIKEKETK